MRATIIYYNVFDILYSWCYSLEEIIGRYRTHVDEEAAVCRRAELEKVSQNFLLCRGVDL
jgi:predicted DsbA family dithiol-disulfide isomerase